MTIWDLAIKERKIAESKAQTADSDTSTIQNQSHLLICGSKEAGKTSIIQRFLEREEAPKPTVALDYIFGRKSKGSNMMKDVAHIWELGGGISMTKLTEVAITAKNIRKLSVILVLDLAEPKKLWETQQVLLNEIKRRIDQVVSQSSQQDPSLERDLKAKAMERIGVEHADRNMLQPLLVPLVIIGAKFDGYQEFESDKKQMIGKSLRFLAHMNGAMLQFFSTKAEGLSTRVKGVLSHLAFNTSLSKTMSIDHTKPIIVPFGLDSFEQIGTPPVQADNLVRMSRGGTPYDLWSDSFSSVFPAQKQEKNDNTNPAADPQFSEESVDALRKQKDQELERYRKLCERKAKEAELNATVGKSSTKSKKR